MPTIMFTDEAYRTLYDCTALAGQDIADDVQTADGSWLAILSDGTYGALKAQQQPGETLSDTVIRLCAVYVKLPVVARLERNPPPMDPEMSEILASIRRILADESET